ncbi:MAG: SAM-dependent methyltransferase [Candidatus Hydrogenedentota bacterium]|nr:MAG: SAM-dependent methyltransferase [Candidatus Hydrogenedentota bacterium]
MSSVTCIFCGSSDQQLILPLGQQPLSNAYLKPEQANLVEPTFPLDLYLCKDCMLSHIEVVATSEEIFSDYAYFSSFSTSWLEHCKHYVSMITKRLSLNADSLVIEVASNDGYLLQYFVEENVPCLGIEPAANVAKEAVKKGVPTQVAFWGEDTARALADDGKQADLILGNNVFAHVPTLNDFVEGFKQALKPGGVVTLEFPHLLQLIRHNQFDTIYHEHFSYFAFFVAQKIFAAHGMRLFDVEELPTHGGSLRIYACHDDDTTHPETIAVAAMLDQEKSAGLMDISCYESFAQNVETVRADLLEFLKKAKDDSKMVVGYGAPAKGNTLLNYCGISTDLIAYTVDRSPHKQDLLLPGSHLPIYAPDKIRIDRPDYVIILPWNLKDEIMVQMDYIRDWGGQFVVPIPHLHVID